MLRISHILWLSAILLTKIDLYISFHLFHAAREWQGREEYSEKWWKIYTETELGAGLNEWCGGASIQERFHLFFTPAVFSSSSFSAFMLSVWVFPERQTSILTNCMHPTGYIANFNLDIFLKSQHSNDAIRFQLRKSDSNWNPLFTIPQYLFFRVCRLFVASFSN